MEAAVTLPHFIALGVTWNIYAIFLVLFFGVFLWGLYRAQKAEKLDWLDMLTRDGTKVSATKVLQLVGGVVGTWIIVQVTLQGNLTWDLFAIYLGYVASIDGFSKLIMARYGAERSDDSKRRPRSYEPSYRDRSRSDGPPPSSQRPEDYDDLKY